MASLPKFFVPTFMEADAITRYYETESSFMPAPGFYTDLDNINIRRLAVSIIARIWTSEYADAFVPYLAMNYFDRFASRNPDSDAKVPLVAICCLTLAAKMRTNSFSVDMIPAGIYDFNHTTIRTMELRILDGLQWQMRPVTPFSFLDHVYPTFLHIAGFTRRCMNEIIVQAQAEERFIVHKPSDFVFSCFLAAILIWNRSKLPSIEILGERSHLHRYVASFCRNKNIRIECVDLKKAFSSKAAAAKPQGQSDSSSSSSAAVVLPQGPSEGPSSSAAAATETEPDQQTPEGTETSEEIAAAATETEPDQQRPEGTETSEEIAAAATETEPDQQRSEGTETSEEIAAATTETEPDQQRLEALRGEPEDVSSETESEKQRRLDRGKSVAVSEVERDDEDGEDPLAQFFENMLDRVETPIEGTVPAAEAAAPRRLMDFDLKWPTYDPLEDETRTPTIRHPTMEAFNVELELMNEEKSCCDYLTCGCCNP
ncbi:unnamed protein product [Lupinus luteus]|uniref:B-like cyclin n=1 Tax=Lupinus luteus TaxID=3873 RepID=A0AAV1WM70_LUPLU